MNAVLIIAWRNIWRRPRRTILTVATVSLGLALLLVSIGLGDGGHDQMIESAVRTGSGHVVIQQKGYQEEGGVDQFLSVADQEAAYRWLSRAAPAHMRILGRTFASGMVSSAEDAAGVRIIGMDPEAESGESLFSKKLQAGTFLETADSDGAIIGAGIAQKLALSVGDKLVLTAQAARGGEIQSVLARVSGIMKTGMEEIDHGVVLIPLSTAQRFFRMDGGMHQMALLLPDSRLADAVAGNGREALGNLEVLTWAEALPQLRDFILIDDAGNYLFNAVFFLLIGLLVLNTILMSVLERSREFALLDALGLPPGHRFFMILMEGFFIAALSAGAGLALGYAGHLYLATAGLPLDLFYEGDLSAGGVTFDPVIYSHLSANRIIGCVGLVFALTIILSVLPARKAAAIADAHLLGRG